MIKLRTLSATIVLLVLSIGLAITSAKAAPESPTIVSTATPLLSNLLNIASTIGDDNFATADLTALLDPSSTSAQHYGPYASGTPDSGTCGNDWANDAYQRHFTIFNRAGSVVVVEQFKEATFTTVAGPSPGACETTPFTGGLVAAGVTGNFRGYFIIQIPTGIGQSSTNPNCDAITMMSPPAEPCFTSTFIDSHFLE